MVGYVFWQQNRVLHAVSSLSSFVSANLAPQPELQAETDEDSETENDDRLSVHEEKEVVSSVEVPVVEPDVDDLKTKSAAELRDLLSKKGIPYGKRDSKNVLLQLLNASS